MTNVLPNGRRITGHEGLMKEVSGADLLFCTCYIGVDVDISNI
jgi:hypothetical protein